MKNYSIIALFIVLFASCKSQYELILNSNDMDLKYDAAFAYFDAAKYSKAASLFESLAVVSSGTEQDDTIQFYWGLSNYKLKDYYTAEANLLKFIETYSRSPFTKEARYLRVDCLYRQTLRYELDQSPTHMAMGAINEYLIEYPGSEHEDRCREMFDDLAYRLDTKAFESARIYYRMEDYIASGIAFKNILKEDSENAHREHILYYIAMSSYKYATLSVQAKQKERYLSFIDDYLNFVGELPDSKYRRELDVMYKRTQKALGKYTDLGDDEVLEDKDFIKERRKLDKAAKKVAKENK